MTLDEQLRATLHGRAAALDPLADPLAGIERRARGLRRRRLAASVGGTALAVAAVAGAVPLLEPDRGAAPSDVASPPSSAPSARPSAPSGTRPGLDPLAPWAYRGDPALVGTQERAAFRWAWAARLGRDEREVSWSPLFGQVWEPSGLTEIAYVATDEVSGASSFGVVVAGQDGPRTAWEAPLEPGATVLVAPLPADEGGSRLLVIASPDRDLDALRYDADGAGAVPAQDLAERADGVGTGPAQASAPDALVLGVVGEEVVLRAPVPALETEDLPGRPGNVLAWPVRGTVDPALVLAVRRAYAASKRAPLDDVESKVLFAGAAADGPGYLIGQFWLRGAARADTFGGVGSDEDLRVESRPPATAATRALALHLSPARGSGGGTLVVVPRPGTGQVEYDADGTDDWVPKDTPGLDAVVLFERDPAAERAEGPEDRVRLLDGHGREITTLSVRTLLCGRPSCR